MHILRLGIICPSEIAFRRFMPAAVKIKNLDIVGIGASSAEERFGKNVRLTDDMFKILSDEREKAKSFVCQYGGKVYESYEAIASAKEIDALYIPLPPALHYRWAKRALEAGKHVLVEKPATTSARDTRELVSIAQRSSLSLHENYMFIFHNQLNAIDEIIQSGELGDVRLYRVTFGFPRRSSADFRYSMALGGGALLDAGGYTLKYASRLLGSSAAVKFAQLNYLDEFEVDIGGSATVTNDSGITAQLAFGMDNSYQCKLEVWGSKGHLTTGRVLTAPAGFIPEAKIAIGDKTITRKLPEDDAFEKSICHFVKCINDDTLRAANYRDIIKQAEMVDFVKGYDKHGKNSDN